MKKFQIFAGFTCFATMLAGCTSMSDYMAAAQKSCYTPQPGKALVVFLRPSSFGGMIQSSVFDVEEPEDALIGIVSSKTRIAYQAEPGEHTFMVIGENADFLRADLDADKTYYVLDEVRMGWWKARFSLLPIRNDPGAPHHVHSKEFTQWMAETHFVTTTPGAYAWYKDNKASVEAKQKKYRAEWQAKSAADKAQETLYAQDGLIAPLCQSDAGPASPADAKPSGNP